MKLIFLMYQIAKTSKNNPMILLFWKYSVSPELHQAVSPEFYKKFTKRIG